METSAEGAAEAHSSGTAQAAEPVTAEPAAVAVEVDPTAVTIEADSTAVVVEADPAAVVIEAGPTAVVVEADPAGGDAAGATPRSAIAPASLSPSRASDFMQCPLLYRFRVIDRLPEKPSEAATRGTLVHAVLERLFDAPAVERTAPRAKSLIPAQWDRLRETRPEVVELFEDDPEGERLARWLGEAEQLVERWFTLEDPTRLEPAERELWVEAELESGLTLRGIIDRVDVAPTGEVRIVDYKTGKAPRPEYAEGALFQMKFYALVVWRLKNVVPRRLQLVYLGSGDVLTYDPVLADLERVERKLLALWEAIRQATESGDWRPRPTKLCGWCDHQAHCPEFGGTPPPYPLPVRAAESTDVTQGRMGPD
ncbi:PD-(D/E)XK nuclease family protein [Streptomyces sp. NBC_00201]|uniref:RecB family exonuclease n=1 Tax=unclassified Streptomyces TaxID=2593676 RepID=UPI002256DB71|nr:MULTISPECIES: PD-(D/E)XK nuclease family protein [unclassified Streptomyces]MCX5058331.1 PD-(D/E)XK nuclease family protein [Streptomyces sp. NBC_00452]MCX5244789.1 PD-(D/E)XK nuclease family protein [Streptomyces sp. NBC_00201]MCX5289479.1 PD-(D/E)XK nuclease family protein [Streptomyces sp. NBC_00183]